MDKMYAWDGLTIDDIDLANIAMNVKEDAILRARKRRKNK